MHRYALVGADEAVDKQSIRSTPVDVPAVGSHACAEEREKSAFGECLHVVDRRHGVHSMRRNRDPTALVNHGRFSRGLIECRTTDCCRAAAQNPIQNATFHSRFHEHVAGRICIRNLNRPKILLLLIAKELLVLRPIQTIHIWNCGL